MSRIGFGYDSHRFADITPHAQRSASPAAPARFLVLCGVTIPGSPRLIGHSDADAALHAVIDAILGACGGGDIGELFPDTDAQYKDADSAAMLARALASEVVRDYRVANCDLTIVTETPRLAAHKPAMRQRLAELLGVEADRVSVKAKTNEGMGAIGRREGLAVMAAVLMEPRDTRDTRPADNQRG